MPHPTNVIAVGVGDDREIDGGRLVVGRHVVDKLLAAVVKTGVDHDVAVASRVRSGETNRNCVSMPPSITDGQEVDFVHLSSLSSQAWRHEV